MEIEDWSWSMNRTRYFRYQIVGRNAIVHDPCTGLTHIISDLGLSNGPVEMDENLVASMPVLNENLPEQTAPFSLCWSPIVACNLECPHCLDDKSLKAAGADTRRKLARIISESGVLGVDISGGEPLLIPELPELVVSLKRGGIAVSVTTNGSYLTKRLNELVNVVDALRFSFDGSTSTTHDFWRGSGSFESAVEGLRASISRRIPVQIQFVAMRSNVGELQSLIDFAVDEKATGVTVLQMLPIGEGAKLADREMLSDDELLEAVEALRISDSLRLRIRYRKDAGGFVVVRADGSVYQNDSRALTINRQRTLTRSQDLQIIQGPGR